MSKHIGQSCGGYDFLPSKVSGSHSKGLGAFNDKTMPYLIPTLVYLRVLVCMPPASMFAGRAAAVAGLLTNDFVEINTIRSMQLQ